MSLESITLPAADEYTEGQQRYISLGSEGGDVLALLGTQPDVYRRTVFALSDDAASTRPAPEEWSVKEVIGHVADAERVFAYRLVALARGEKNTLPSFDHNGYVELGAFNQRTLASLLDEFEHQRRANLLAIAALDEAAIARRGNISTYQQTVRALVYVMAGHAQHHIVSLQTDYGLG
jgi:uncharacterized damage-inducible protein DinB